MKDGAYIARLLNLSAKEPLLHPKCRAIEEMALDLDAMTKEAHVKPSAPYSPEEIIRRRAERENRLEKFNATHLRPFTWHVELIGWNHGIPVFADVPDGDSETFVLIQLARVQLLDRLRRCARCDVWFFAVKPWARFHDRSCYKAAVRSKPGFKEENRKYQGKHFREQISVNKKLYRKGFSPAEVRALKKRKSQTKKKHH